MGSDVDGQVYDKIFKFVRLFPVCVGAFLYQISAKYTICTLYWCGVKRLCAKEVPWGYVYYNDRPKGLNHNTVIYFLIVMDILFNRKQDVLHCVKDIHFLQNFRIMTTHYRPIAVMNKNLKRSTSVAIVGTIGVGNVINISWIYSSNKKMTKFHERSERITNRTWRNEQVFTIAQGIQ